MREVPLGQLAEQCGQEHAHVGDDPDVDGLVEAEHLLVEVDLDHPLVLRRAPVRRLAPPVGLAEAGPQCQHDVGVVAHLLREFDVGHGYGDQAALVDHVARAPARGHGCAQPLGNRAQLRRRGRVQHATARVDHRELRVDEHVRGLAHRGRIGRDGRLAPGARRRRVGRGRRLELAVHHVFGDAQVDHARPTLPRDAQRAPEQLRDAFVARRRAGPLRHRSRHRHLVEVLVGATPIGAHDRGAPPTGQEQHAVALAALDRDAGQRVRGAGSVARDAHAEATGEPRVRAGHVHGGGLVPRGDEADAVVAQPRVEAEVGAVDDAEDRVDALGLEHLHHAFPAQLLGHLAPSLLAAARRGGGWIDGVTVHATRINRRATRTSAAPCRLPRRSPRRAGSYAPGSSDR